MTDKELQKHLASYKIEIDEKAKKKPLKCPLLRQKHILFQ